MQNILSNLSPLERKAICINHLQKLNFEAVKAINENKIFKIYGSCEVLRKALIERGWIEKITYSKEKNRQYNNDYNVNEVKTYILSKLVQEVEPNFVYNAVENWNYKKYQQNPKIIYNRFYVKAPWTQKKALCIFKTNKKYIDNVAEVYAPYTYMSCDKNEKEEFVLNYKLTACTSLLKFILLKVENDVPIFVNSGNVSIQVFIFAINRCKEYLNSQQNKHIDKWSFPTISNKEWKSFFKNYYLLITNEDMLELKSKDKLPLYLDLTKILLNEIERYRPLLSCEGHRNIWIVKPNSKSIGHEIKISSKLDCLCKLINKPNYIFQKYIEEPLLIHRTKFTIRQFFLITSTSPLEVWMYEDCYLMFSSQEYSLRNFHESIHFANYEIQRNFENSSDLHPDLPANKMWSSDTFKEYLQTHFEEDAWDTIIYPGMKKSIIGVLLSFQDSLPYAKNRFELYGCDFILDKNYKPWLIKMISCPDLDSTTSVTAKLYPAVISDLVKVVFDRAKNNDAETGKFEYIYGQKDYVTYPKKPACFISQGSRILGFNNQKVKTKQTKTQTFKEDQPNLKTLINVLKIKHNFLPLQHKSSCQSKKSSLSSIAVASKILDAVFTKPLERMRNSMTKDPQKLRKRPSVPNSFNLQEPIKKANTKLSLKSPAIDIGKKQRTTRINSENNKTNRNKNQCTYKTKEMLKDAIQAKKALHINSVDSECLLSQLNLNTAVHSKFSDMDGEIQFNNESISNVKDDYQSRTSFTTKNVACECIVPVQVSYADPYSQSLAINDEMQYNNGSSRMLNVDKNAKTSLPKTNSVANECIVPVQVPYTVPYVPLTKMNSQVQYYINKTNTTTNFSNREKTPLPHTKSAACEYIVPVQNYYAGSYEQLSDVDGQIRYTNETSRSSSVSNSVKTSLPHTYNVASEFRVPVQHYRPSPVIVGQLQYTNETSRKTNFINRTRQSFPHNNYVNKEYIGQSSYANIYAQSPAMDDQLTNINTTSQMSNTANKSISSIISRNVATECLVPVQVPMMPYVNSSAMDFSSTNKTRQISNVAIQTRIPLTRDVSTECIVPLHVASLPYVQSSVMHELPSRNITSKVLNGKLVLPRTKYLPVQVYDTIPCKQTSDMKDHEKFVLSEQCFNINNEMSNVETQARRSLPRTTNISSECTFSARTPCNIPHVKMTVMNGQINTHKSSSTNYDSDVYQSRLASSIASIKKLPSKCKPKTKFSFTTSKPQAPAVVKRTRYVNKGIQIRRPVYMLLCDN